MNIAVYCGASFGNNDNYKKCAEKLGEWIGKNSYTLIYGGGKVGLMGIVADTVLANKSEVIGIMPEFLVKRELAHTNITKLEVVKDMSIRKKKMIDLADVFIALPGGPGTLEEISEVISWSRIGQNANPCILYNENSYYDYLKLMYNKMVEEGFLSKEDNEKILFTDSVEEISEFIKNYVPPKIRKY